MSDQDHGSPSDGAPPFRSIIEALPLTIPFVGPETLERARGRRFAARIGANENGFGPSPRAVQAMASAAVEAWKYADPTSYDLIAALARHIGVSPDSIVIGEGIDGLLGLTVHLFVDPGATVVTSDGAYPTFNFHVANHGGRLVKVPYRDDREDIPALLHAARKEQAAILYLANPDNPMGSWWPRGDIEAMVGQLPPRTVLVLDEAYIDTLAADERPRIDPAHPQVVRFRTFSKAYGLAGARIGYAVGNPRLIAAFEKVRNHYGINRAGQLGALAALDDQDYLTAVVARIDRAKARIGAIAASNGLRPLPSASGFVAVDCGRDGAYAKAILDGLIARDVFVRKPAVAPLDRCIRVSAGPDADLDVLAAALPQAVADAGGSLRRES